MNYEVQIIKKENYKVSNWSGGKTTELYIYPPDAKYSERNFDFRLSAATVEAEVSEFTNLPGIARQIIVTEEKTTLVHQGRYEITLNAFEKDSFMGDWETKSYGKASDFNLMTSKACSGSLKVMDFKGGNKIETVIKQQRNSGTKVMEFFYVIGGRLQLMLQGDKFRVDEKDLFCVSYLADESSINLSILKEAEDDVKIIRAVINLKHLGS